MSSDPARCGTERSDATVLVVEDDADLADLFEVWLSDISEVRLAHLGEEGLEAMRDDIDVILLDRRVPRMNGDEFLQAIADDGSDARVVMVSAVEPDLEIVNLPFDDYVTKPVTRDVIMGVIDRMLRLGRTDPAVRRCHSLERRRGV